MEFRGEKVASSPSIGPASQELRRRHEADLNPTLTTRRGIFAYGGAPANARRESVSPTFSAGRLRSVRFPSLFVVSSDQPQRLLGQGIGSEKEPVIEPRVRSDTRPQSINLNRRLNALIGFSCRIGQLQMQAFLRSFLIGTGALRRSAERTVTKCASLVKCHLAIQRPEESKKMSWIRYR